MKVMTAGAGGTQTGFCCCKVFAVLSGSMLCKHGVPAALSSFLQQFSAKKGHEKKTAVQPFVSHSTAEVRHILVGLGTALQEIQFRSSCRWAWIKPMVTMDRAGHLRDDFCS